MQETEEERNPESEEPKQEETKEKWYRESNPEDRSEATDAADAEPAEKEQRCQRALKKLQDQTCEDNLWECVVAFEGETFRTASGLPFVYTLKTGRSGLPTKELWINRRAQSKSLSWGSVRLAYRKARELTGTIVPRPKALGDVRGVSYVYPILWRFGLIEVPEEAAGKMAGILGEEK